MLEYFSAAKTVIDCIIAIKDNAKFGDRALKRDFNKVIAPLFENLQPLVDDYFALLHRAHKSANESKTRADIISATEELIAHREKMLTLRVRVREEASALSELLHDHAMNSFLGSVVKLFDAPFEEIPPVRKMSGMLRVVTLFEALEQIHSDTDWGNSIEAIRKNLSNSRQCLERNWLDTVQNYYRLRSRHILDSI